MQPSLCEDTGLTIYRKLLEEFKDVTRQEGYLREKNTLLDTMPKSHEDHPYADYLGLHPNV